MKVVVDASVVVKWVLPAAQAEEDIEQATILLKGIGGGSVALLQPPHWLAEVVAVVTRLDPEAAEPALELLYAMEFPVTQELPVYVRASRIARALNHHVFDTLYHAVALEFGHSLITADGRYFRKARRLGQIVQLANWQGAAPRPEGRP